jgi:hypothetical protein
MPDGEYFERVVGDAVVDVVARAAHENAPYTAKVVIVRLGRSPSIVALATSATVASSSCTNSSSAAGRLDLHQLSIVAASSAARG